MNTDIAKFQKQRRFRSRTNVFSNPTVITNFLINAHSESIWSPVEEKKIQIPPLQRTKSTQF